MALYLLFIHGILYIYLYNKLAHREPAWCDCRIRVAPSGTAAVKVVDAAGLPLSSGVPDLVDEGVRLNLNIVLVCVLWRPKHEHVSRAVDASLSQRHCLLSQSIAPWLKVDVEIVVVDVDGRLL